MTSENLKVSKATWYPGKYFLNNFGLQACQFGQIPVNEMRRSDLSIGKGFNWNKLKKDRLNHFIKNNYLSSIEISKIEFSDKRSAFIELMNQIFEALLEREMRENLSIELDSNHLIKKFVGRHIGPHTFKEFEHKYPRTIHHFSHILTEKLTEKYYGSISPILLAERIEWLLEKMGSAEWFMLAVAKPAETRAQMIDKVFNKLVGYIQFLEMGNSFAFTLVEALQKVELNHLVQLAEKDLTLRLKPELAMSKLHDASFREKITNNANEASDLVHAIITFDLGIKGNIVRVDISGRSAHRLASKIEPEILDFHSPLFFAFEKSVKTSGYKFRYAKKSDNRHTNQIHSFTLMYP